MTRLMVFAASAALVLRAGLALGAQPGVDCRKAKSWADQAVCGDDELLNLDARLAELARAAGKALQGPSSKQFRDQQKTWLRSRDECRNRRSPVACLEDLYRRRIDELEEPSGRGTAPPPLVRPRPAGPLDECYRDAGTRLEVGPCLERRLDRARDDLASANARVEAAARELDAATGRSRAWEGFRDAAGAWERYRDAECAWRRERAAGGSGEGDIYLACLVELTQQRVADLRSNR